MAGSYRHVTNKDNEFIGIDLIDNLGDAFETIEEMYFMIQYLTNGDKSKVHEAWRKGYADKLLPKENERLFTHKRFWED